MKSEDSVGDPVLPTQAPAQGAVAVEEWDVLHEAQYQATAVAMKSKELSTEVADLRRTLKPLMPLEKARSMLMRTYSCSAETAGHILAEVAQETHSRVRYVAERLVEGADGPAPCKPIRDALDFAVAQFVPSRTAATR